MPTETGADFHFDRWKEYTDDFTLPFPVVAVEDKVSCGIMWDCEHEAQGIGVKRGFMEAVALENVCQPGAFKTADDVAMLTELSPEWRETGTTSIRWGYITADWRETDCKWLCSEVGSKLEGSLVVQLNKDRRPLDLLSFAGDASGEAYTDFKRAALTVYEELLRLMDPGVFVLERSPLRQSKERYKRSEERPNYTILRPGAIRRYLQLPQQAEQKDHEGRVITERRAHWRREHTRTLRSAKYGDRQGETLSIPRSFIPALWYGESEATVGKHHYRVIL